METTPTKYGLPAEVKFCARCVISNQRPNSTVEYKHEITSCKATIHFDEEGVCDACRVAEKKKRIDWEEREQLLWELCNKHRRSDGRYDCIVPGSGGKDSFYAAHTLKYKYNMHPLTVTWAPHIYTEWGWRNFQRWMHSGLDNVLVTPNGKVHRLLTRLAVDELLHPFQPFMIGQKNMAPKLALQHHVRLVFYGESEAEYGNPIADIGSAKREWASYASHDLDKMFLSGVPIRDLKGTYGLEDNDLLSYMPANPFEMEANDVEVHYLGYYLKWHPQSCYYYAAEHGGFECSPERTLGTYSKYNSIDDKMDDLHYYTTFVKFGIGRATYDAAQEIRSGDITREEGVALVKRYDGEYPFRFEKEIFEYLNLENFTPYDRSRFIEHCEKFKSLHLWEPWTIGGVALSKLRHVVW